MNTITAYIEEIKQKNEDYFFFLYFLLNGTSVTCHAWDFYYDNLEGILFKPEGLLVEQNGENITNNLSEEEYSAICKEAMNRCDNILFAEAT